MPGRTGGAGRAEPLLADGLDRSVRLSSRDALRLSLLAVPSALGGLLRTSCAPRQDEQRIAHPGRCAPGHQDCGDTHAFHHGCTPDPTIQLTSRLIAAATPTATAINCQSFICSLRVRGRPRTPSRQVYGSALAGVEGFCA